MPAHLVRSDALYPGAPYAYASVASPGGLIFTAGACPIDETGKVTAVGDYVRQAADAMANLVTALAAAGASLSDVLKTTVYVASGDRRDLHAVWEVVHSAFGAHDAPSTLLGVSVCKRATLTTCWGLRLQVPARRLRSRPAGPNSQVRRHPAGC
jgi:enamine deaminase RidA (YjgF/YER057c/UK114 family)